MVFERQKLLVDVRFFETGDISDYLFFETLTYLRRTHSNLIVSQAGVRMSSTNELADMNRPPDLLTSEKRTFVSRITSIGAFLIEEYQGLHGRVAGRPSRRHLLVVHSLFVVISGTPGGRLVLGFGAVALDKGGVKRRSAARKTRTEPERARCIVPLRTAAWGPRYVFASLGCKEGKADSSSKGDCAASKKHRADGAVILSLWGEGSLRGFGSLLVFRFES
jgi:hypothetical protein